MINLNVFDELVKNITEDIQYNVAAHSDFKLEKILNILDEKNVSPEMKKEIQSLFKAGVNPSLIFSLLNFFKKIDSEKTSLEIFESYIKYLKTKDFYYLSQAILNTILILKNKKQENVILLFLSIFNKFNNFKSQNDFKEKNLLLLLAVQNYQLIYFQLLLIWFKNRSENEFIKHLIFWTIIYLQRQLYGNKFEKFYNCFNENIIDLFEKNTKDIKDTKNISNIKKLITEKQKIIEEYFLSSIK